MQSLLCNYNQRMTTGRGAGAAFNPTDRATTNSMSVMPLRHRAALGDPFQPLSVLSGRHTGTNRGGRGRSHGSSSFNSTRGIFKPSRSWLTPAIGRRGGEIFPRKSSSFAWSVSPPPQSPGEKDMGLPPVPTPFAPLRETDQNANEGEGELDARLASSVQKSVASDAEWGGKGVWGASFDVDDVAKAELEASAVKAASTAASTLKGKRRHRRRVTWAVTVETREVERAPQWDVFSPDLHSLALAQQLAIAADAPEISQAAQEVLMARRQAAGIARSMSANDGWSGSLEGVEETWRAWDNRECLYLRETDELVRGVICPRSRGDLDSTSTSTVYHLKAAYRAARRRMQDIEGE